MSSIVVVCPHCETRFTLQAEMAGKSMRCPNLECRQVFTVVPAPIRETAAPEPVKPEKPKKGKASAPVGEQLPILDAKLAPAKGKGKSPAPGGFEVVESGLHAPPNVKEVVWSGQDAMFPPSTRPAPPPAATVEDESELDLPVLRKRKKKKKKGGNKPVMLLMGGLILTLGLGFFAVRTVFKRGEADEGKVAAEAAEQFKKTEYAAAAKKYDELVTRFGESKEIPKYKFMSGLSGLFVAVRSVTNREDPEGSLKKFREFAEANKGSPLIKPTKDTYGEYMLDVGKKVGEDMASYAEDRLKDYKKDRAKTDEMAKAEKVIAAVREFGPGLEQYRATDSPPPFDAVYGRLEKVEREIKFERTRTAVLAKIRGILATPTDKGIEQANALAAENKLDADDEVKGLIEKAKGDLKALVKWEPLPNDPRTPPASSAASLLFVAPIGQTRPVAKLPNDPGPSVFLAVARGVLYALDEDSGELLWATRVGTDVFDPPAVARVDVDGETKEVAVVTSNVAGQPGLTGVELRTGKARWFQPLNAPAAGPAVVQGTRAFVPIRDDLGSVYAFDLTKGQQLGRITLTQPIGPAALRPGTSLLYVPADARRVYVVDVGGKDDDGRQQDPKCVQVIATNHLSGTLRTPPLILGPAGDQPADRWLVLSQADGPTTMKLRAFTIAQGIPPGDGGPPPETQPDLSAELSVPGWAWFPPVTDGERLAIVTDAGQLRLFGVNQPGNADKAMFPLPFPTMASPADGTPVPGFVVPAEESAFWVLAGGVLQKMRLSLVPSEGLKVVASPRRIALGVPTQSAQMNLRRDSACFVVRSAAGTGFRAALINLKDGEPRWQRQLGVAPAAPPIPHGDGVLMVDEDGGVTLVPAAVAAVKPGETKSAEPGWVVASSLDEVTGPTHVAVSPDGKVVHTVTPKGTGKEAKWVVRKIENGAVARTGEVTPPAALAGPPVAFADGLLLPAADGFVYRLFPGDGGSRPDTLKQGLRWWEDRRTTDPTCFLTVVSSDAFLTTDGGKVLTRWTWSGTDMSPGNATWEVRDRVAVPPLVLPGAGGQPPRVLVADATGSVWMYDATRAGQPLRRWRAGGTTPIPSGKPTSRLALGTDANGRFVVTYVVANHTAVCFAPDKDVLWVAKTGDDTGSSLVGAPRQIADGRWLISDLSGKVRALDGGTGQPVASGAVSLPGVVPAGSGSQVDKSRMLVPLSDGSSVVVPVGDAPPPPDKK